MTTITIAAINIQSGISTTKGHFHYPLTVWKYWLPHSDKPIFEAAKMLKKESVDIACITEISERSLRTAFRSQTQTLADKADMEHKHFFSLQKLGKIFFHEGNAIISRYKIINPHSHPLHIELMRMALEEATIEIEDQKITIFVVHLALTRKHRIIQIEEIIEILKDRKGPIVLAGDFNERDPKALGVILNKTSLKHLCTDKTFPSWNPKHSLDYILLSEHFTVLDCSISKNKAFSDHAPLVVKAELNSDIEK